MNLFYDFILITGIVITILILIFLYNAKRKQLPKKILIVFFLTLLCVSLNTYAEVHEIEWLYVLSYIPYDTVSWCVAPLLFMYIKSLFLEEKHVLKTVSPHFIPWFIYLVTISIPILISVIYGAPIFPYLNDTFLNLIFFIEDVYLIIYLIISLRLFSKYRTAMKLNYSSLTEDDFGWVRILLIGALVVISLDLILTLVEVFYIELYEDNEIVITAMIGLILYLGYYGVHQSRVLLPDFLIQETTVYIEQRNTKEKVIPIVSNLHKEEYEHLKKELDHILEKEKPYLDEDLTLYKLAHILGVTDKKLSTLLNQYMHVTFYDLINKYRVAAIKEKMTLDAYQHYTLLGISYECGFKSKTSFNRIFKKETGLSPSAYKKSITQTV